MTRKLKVAVFANTDWYLLNFRLSLFERLRSAGHDVLLLSPPGRYGARLQALGFRWIPVDMDRRSLHPVREARLVLALRNLLRAERPDLIHNMTIKCAVYGSMAASMAGVRGKVNAINGLGYVFTSDDRLARTLRVPVRSLMRLAFGGKHSRLVVQNPDDRRVFERSGFIRPEFIREIPGSGVDCVRFSPASAAHERASAYRVLLPARLLRDKGIYEFVDAARHLAGQGFEFLIAGEADPGNPAAVPISDVQRWQEEGLVTLLGHVDDMVELFHSVDTVVLPSYREGLPRALIEAAASGLPLIATDVPGCREVVSNGIDGFLVPVRDSAALADAILKLRDAPELARAFGRRAREKALDRFSQDKIVDATIAVYEEIL